MLRRVALGGALVVCIVVSILGPGEAVSRKRPRATAAATQAALPGAVDARSLGFGSPKAHVPRLLGRPTRIAKVRTGEVWYYGLSTISISGGAVVGWSVYDRPLPVNIGSAKPGAPPIKKGMTAQQLVAALGTPQTVVAAGDTRICFYDKTPYTLQKGRLVPSSVSPPLLVASDAQPPRTATKR